MATEKDIEQFSKQCNDIFEQISRDVVGQKEVVEGTVIAMIAGRLVWGAVQMVLSGLVHSEFTPALFLAGAVTNAIPGIVLHLALIPVVVMAMERAGLSLND